MTQSQDESRRHRRTAKRILAVGLPLVVVVGTGVGYAYWTTGAGTGSGTADAAASVSPVTLSGSITGLVPGGYVDAPVFAKNTNSTTSVGLNSVGISTGAVPTTGVQACDTVSGATATFTPVTMPVVVPPSGTGAGTQIGVLRVTMSNTSTDQDPCKSKTFTVALTSS